MTLKTEQVANKRRNAQPHPMVIKGTAIFNEELGVVEVPLTPRPEIPTSRVGGVFDDAAALDPTSEV